MSLTKPITPTKLELLIAAWLTATTQSKRSEASYNETLRRFLAELERHELAFNSDAGSVATVMRIWAGSQWTLAQRPIIEGEDTDTSRPMSRDALPNAGFDKRGHRRRRPETISGATYNQRLAVVSSFYTYLQKEQNWQEQNPIALVRRRSVQAYSKAKALKLQVAARRLARIGNTTPQDLRDFALLWCAIVTGRRVSEIAGIRRQHLTIVDGQPIEIYFPQLKGGKNATITLPPEADRALRSWLATLDQLPKTAKWDEQAVWISLSDRSRGKAISVRTLKYIVQQRLKTNFHSLRHTFAEMMLKAGANIRTLRDLLGHSSLATTDAYVSAHGVRENPFGEQLEAMLQNPDEDEEDS